MAQVQKIQSLQVLRGVAAIFVALYHVYIILDEHTGVKIFEPLTRFGFLGVNLFFVISGLVIFTVHRADFGEVSRIPNYLYKRFSRVYPIYWIYLTVFLVAAYAGLGYPDFSWAPINIFSSYALFSFNDPVTFPLKVAWTLFYEIRFYLIFIVFFFSRTLGYVVCSIWAALLVAAYFLKLDAPLDMLEPWNVYFLFGIVGALMVERLSPTWGIGLFAAGLAMLVYYGTAYYIPVIAVLAREYSYLHFLLAPAFTLVLTGLILAERRYSLKMPKLAMFVGDASYSIYLVHSAVISLLSIIAAKFGLMALLGQEILFVVLFLASVTAGSVAYLLVEVPLMKLMRGRSATRTYPMPAPSTGS